ncbi:hypothetical protein A2856_02880 [Candidatus Uhrbacteria bacterium RIFCSPHIGHO2_01_FULL_63_20]|uniref:Uncharacterized protein n=1 Tax=Candidatus Uhrbacteria bacterium RIFCSPHIGHO2_01_FULL_63_20 TaxID=1802385 RepID=A0A1F7TKU2_9BACT|nr:MAG: hypothetical protein A2856_02880 [Candidatus Uhrbacteria bacterium RIFCSPHIGHO2_01_FULL_63_20]
MRAGAEALRAAGAVRVDASVTHALDLSRARASLNGLVHLTAAYDHRARPLSREALIALADAV